MKVPDYGIEISFIDNTIATLENEGAQGPVAKLSDGFMCNSIEHMAEFCEETAKKLRAMK